LKYNKKDEEHEDPIWKVGSKKQLGDDEEIEEMRNMPKQPKASAHEWLCKLVDCEWNTDAALEEFGAGDLFCCDDGTVEGANLFWRRDAEKRESEKVAKAIRQIEPEPPIEEPESQSESEPEPEPEPESVEPLHGDEREDGKIYYEHNQPPLWIAKDKWEKLERIRKPLPV
jgi:hypothetical protein